MDQTLFKSQISGSLFCKQNLIVGACGCSYRSEKSSSPSIPPFFFFRVWDVSQKCLFVPSSPSTGWRPCASSRWAMRNSCAGPSHTDVVAVGWRVLWERHSPRSQPNKSSSLRRIFWEKLMMRCDEWWVVMQSDLLILRDLFFGCTCCCQVWAIHIERSEVFGVWCKLSLGIFWWSNQQS